MRNALEILETERIWDQLRARYFEAWKVCDPEEWPTLALKLDMIVELREELRRVGNSGDMDNARGTGTE